MARKPRSRSPAAGGALIAIGAMGGAFVGFFLGEATPGFLIGTAAGIAVAVAMWALNIRQ